MFSSDIHSFKHHNWDVTLSLRSTEIMIMGLQNGKMSILSWVFLDGNYILCQRTNSKTKTTPPSVIETLKDLIEKYDFVNKKLSLDGTVLQRGKLEAILEESEVNEEVIAFEKEGEEFMLVFWKPCIEYFDEET